MLIIRPTEEVDKNIQNQILSEQIQPNQIKINQSKLFICSQNILKIYEQLPKKTQYLHQLSSQSLKNSIQFQNTISKFSINQYFIVLLFNNSQIQIRLTTNQQSIYSTLSIQQSVNQIDLFYLSGNTIVYRFKKQQHHSYSMIKISLNPTIPPKQSKLISLSSKQQYDKLIPLQNLPNNLYFGLIHNNIIFGIYSQQQYNNNIKQIPIGIIKQSNQNYIINNIYFHRVCPPQSFQTKYYQQDNISVINLIKIIQCGNNNKNINNKIIIQRQLFYQTSPIQKLQVKLIGEENSQEEEQTKIQNILKNIQLDFENLTLHQTLRRTPTPTPTPKPFTKQTPIPPADQRLAKQTPTPPTNQPDIYIASEQAYQFPPQTLPTPQSSTPPNPDNNLLQIQLQQNEQYINSIQRNKKIYFTTNRRIFELSLPSTNPPQNQPPLKYIQIYRMQNTFELLDICGDVYYLKINSNLYSLISNPSQTSQPKQQSPNINQQIHQNTPKYSTPNPMTSQHDNNYVNLPQLNFSNIKQINESLKSIQPLQYKQFLQKTLQKIIQTIKSQFQKTNLQLTQKIQQRLKKQTSSQFLKQLNSSIQSLIKKNLQQINEKIQQLSYYSLYKIKQQIQKDQCKQNMLKTHFFNKQIQDINQAKNIIYKMINNFKKQQIQKNVLFSSIKLKIHQIQQKIQDISNKITIKLNKIVQTNKISDSSIFTQIQTIKNMINHNKQHEDNKSYQQSNYFTLQPPKKQQLKSSSQSPIQSNHSYSQHKQTSRKTNSNFQQSYQPSQTQLHNQPHHFNYPQQRQYQPFFPPPQYQPYQPYYYPPYHPYYPPQLLPYPPSPINPYYPSINQPPKPPKQKKPTHPNITQSQKKTHKQKKIKNIQYHHK